MIYRMIIVIASFKYYLFISVVDLCEPKVVKLRYIQVIVKSMSAVFLNDWFAFQYILNFFFVFAKVIYGQFRGIFVLFQILVAFFRTISSSRPVQKLIVSSEKNANEINKVRRQLVRHRPIQK